MEPESVQLLQEIRNALYVLTVFAGFSIFVWLVFIVSRIKANFGRALDNDFLKQADNLYYSGDVKDLAAHCKEKLAVQPNHIYALWWLARVRDEETIFHPLMLDNDILTFVAQSVTCPGMRPFKRLDKKADLFA